MRLTLCLVFVMACAAPSQGAAEGVGASRAARSEPRTAAPGPTPLSASAMVPEGATDAAGEAAVGDAPSVTAPVTPSAAWTDAKTCSFPPVSPAEGTTAKQCCTPVRDLELCLETMSTIHHHEVGPYTKQTLTAIHRSDGEVIVRLPLDRHHHGSLKARDTASVVAVELRPDLHGAPRSVEDLKQHALVLSTQTWRSRGNGSSPETASAAPSSGRHGCS